MRSYLVAIAASLSLAATGVPQDAIRSHAPRPLPAPTNRPMDPGPARFVDPARGSDQNDGSEKSPWKTVQHAAARLKPGDTLYLRGGIYREHVSLKLEGAEHKPITIRSHPGELAILDGGFAEFWDDPAAAWEPDPDGAPGEFRSTRTYKNIEIAQGLFGDSMIPLHGYRFHIDLQTTNEYWNLPNNASTDQGMYCGPGLWFDAKTGRIHCRLAPTTLACLGENNYRGESDPRKLKLVIGSARTPLALDGCRHVRILDVVVRGGARQGVSIVNCQGIELNGVVIHGGGSALYVQSSRDLKFIHCAFRSIAAPWSFRTHHKYRGVAAYLITFRAEPTPTQNVEFAWCDMTDGHDGPFVGVIQKLRFHHNRIDNFNDDGVYLMAMGKGGDLHIHQNHFARCLTTFAFAGKHPVGKGAYIYRNVFDLRGAVPYFPPKQAKDPRFVVEGGERLPAKARLCSDHGSPTWEPIWFYHNTVLTAEPAFRGYYGAGWGGHMNGATRRVFNNIFVQTDRAPGIVFQPDVDMQADGNLHWSPAASDLTTENFFAAFRKSKVFAASKQAYPPGWAAGDHYGDPRFLKFAAVMDEGCDLRLGKDSAARGRGVALPAEWPDVSGPAPGTRPDAGAFAAGAMPLEVGWRAGKWRK
jgi:hypothetical protein